MFIWGPGRIFEQKNGKKSGDTANFLQILWHCPFKVSERLSELTVGALVDIAMSA